MTNRKQAALYLSDRDLAVRYGVCRATIWRWTQAGRLPQPVKFSPGCSRWNLEEVENIEPRSNGVAA